MKELMRRGFRERKAYIIEVDVYATIVREYKVSYRICTLYRLGVIVESV